MPSRTSFLQWTEFASTHFPISHDADTNRIRKECSDKKSVIFSDAKDDLEMQMRLFLSDQSPRLIRPPRVDDEKAKHHLTGVLLQLSKTPYTLQQLLTASNVAADQHCSSKKEEVEFREVKIKYAPLPDLADVRELAQMCFESLPAIAQRLGRQTNMPPQSDPFRKFFITSVDPKNDNLRVLVAHKKNDEQKKPIGVIGAEIVDYAYVPNSSKETIILLGQQSIRVKLASVAIPEFRIKYVGLPDKNNAQPPVGIHLVEKLLCDHRNVVNALITMQLDGLVYDQEEL